MTPQSPTPSDSILQRLGELQQQVERRRDLAAELKAMFDQITPDLEVLEAEAAAKLAVRTSPPAVDTTSAALVQALQSAENDGVHIEIVPTDPK